MEEPGITVDREGYACVKVIFLRAVEMNPEDRPQFLRDACGNDSELRAEVESLLEFHREAETLTGDETEGS